MDITPSLSDETIDELGYAFSTGQVDSSFATPTTIVAGPTKSPPPVLMPRPRLAVHPTLKLTNAFANPVTDSSQQPPSQLATLTEEEFEYPEQPPSTYVTPPLAPPTLKPVGPTPSGSILSTQQMTISNEGGSLKDTMVKETSLGGNQGSTTSSSVSPPKEDSNLNQSVTEKRPPPQSIQSSTKEKVGAKQRTTTDAVTTSPAAPAFATRTIETTSAPIVPSPLVKSTLASQLSTSSKSSSSSTDSNVSLPKAVKSFSTPNHTHSRSPLDQPKQQQHHTIRKAMSTEQLTKSNPYDLRPDPSYIAHSQHPSVEKLLYGNNNGSKASIQQLQQEYLLRQNGYLRRQLEALRVDNMESQRQHQELVSRMKQLEIQLLEKRQSATPTTSGPPTLNEYQHHHYYHHNIFSTVDEDQDHNEDDSDDQQQEHSMEEGQPIKRPINVRRHSTHAPPSNTNPLSPTANRRQRHVTAPSLHHYGKPHPGHDRQQEPRIMRPRSRSVPKNNAHDNQHTFPPTQYRRPQQEEWMYHEEPIYIDNEEENINPTRYHHYRQRPPPGFEEEEGDDEEDSMEFNDPRHFGDFYGPDDEDYLEDQDYYQHHMTAPGPPPPPMMYYAHPPFDRPPPPDTYFNDPYAPPLARRKSASGLRPTRGVPPGFMEIINQPHYDRPPRQPIRRNGPPANRPIPPQHRQRRIYPPEGPDHRPPLHYGRHPGQPRPPPVDYIVSPRPGFGEPHESSPRRKFASTASPRQPSTVPPGRRPSLARGPYPAGSRFNNRV